MAFAKKLEVEGLWVAFGVGKHLRYLPIHKLAGSLTTQQCEGLRFFHAFTRCDTVSYLYFSGMSKKTAFQAWKYYTEVTSVFVYYECHRQSSLSSKSESWNAWWS